MTGIKKALLVILRVVEIFHYVGAALMVAAGVLSFIAPERLKYVMDVEGLLSDPQASVYGFEAVLTNAAGEINLPALAVFAIGGAVILFLMAFIFKHLGKFIEVSEEKTPFCKENLNRLTKIGIFSVAIPLVGIAFSIILRIVLGPEVAEISLNQSGIMMGLVVFVLTSYFAHGVELEQDVDGLL